MARRQFSSQSLALIVIAIAINMVGGQLISMLKLPIFLDSIGTLISAVLLGPVVGMLTGLLTNLLWGILTDPIAAAFAPVAQGRDPIGVGEKIKAGIDLRGGRSAEHEVSLASARAVMDNLAGDDVEVVPIGITREGRWIAGGDPWQALSDGTPEGSAPVALLPDPSQQGELMRLERGGHSPANGAARLAGLDVIFAVLHGTYGEDGTV